MIFSCLFGELIYTHVIYSNESCTCIFKESRFCPYFPNFVQGKKIRVVVENVSVAKKKLMIMYCRPGTLQPLCHSTLSYGCIIHGQRCMLFCLPVVFVLVEVNF
jgi:hypothetical protein